MGVRAIVHGINSIAVLTLTNVPYSFTAKRKVYLQL